MFEIVSVMVLCYFWGGGVFQGGCDFSGSGLNFFGEVEMLSEVFGIFSGGVGIISVVLSLYRVFEIFLGGGVGGDIFRVINFYFLVHGKIETF